MGIINKNISFSVESIDHIVLTVQNIDKTVYFYKNVLNMKLSFYTAKNDNTKRISFSFGTQKINIHSVDKSICLMQKNQLQDLQIYAFYLIHLFKRLD